jgi:hypothetical protein
MQVGGGVMRLWTAILAGLQIVAAGSVLTDLFPKAWVGLFALLVAAAQGGTVFYMKADQGKRPEIAVEGR